jgi:hypothetical protein
MPLVHNFEKGLDLVLDPTGATPLVNHVFISKSGNDGTGTGTPLNPYLTYAAARVAQGTGKTFIIGSGIYTDFNVIGNNATIKGDGLVIFENNGTNYFFSDAVQNNFIEDVVFIGYLSLMTNIGRGIRLTRCFLKDTAWGGTNAANGSFADCTIVNCTINYTVPGNSVFLRNKLINTSFTFSYTYDFTFKNNYLDSTSVVNMSGNTGVVRDFSYNNNQGTLIGTPTVSIGNINTNPLFAGSISDNETLLQLASPMLGGGEGGQNIGNGKFGELLNEASTSFGVSPSANVNTTFISGDLVLTNPILDGSRTSAIIDLGKLYTSPRIKLAGFTDFLNNVASTSNLLSNPNHLTVNIRYAGSNQVYTAYKPFKIDNTGVRILLDAGGKSTGEDGFKWATATTQKLRYIQIQVVVTNNYIVS